MICPKCGNKDNKKKICSKCGYRIDTPITVKNYDDEEVVIDAPIITESHTFIDEEHFQKSIQSHLEKEREEQKRKSNNKMYAIIGIVLIVLVLIGFIILPKILNKNENVVNQPLNSNDFSSTSWNTGEIKLNGIKYKLKEKYSNLEKNSWTVDLEKYGYEKGYILNDGDKTSTTIEMNNPKFTNGITQIGFINSSDEPQDIKKCEIWSIAINNNDVENPIPFELPGNIKTGSTIEDIIKVYGELDESKIYRSEESKYTTYHYQSNYNNYLDLYVYDDKGLMEINLKKY